MHWTLEAALDALKHSEQEFLQEVDRAFDHARRIQREFSEYVRGVLPASVQDEGGDEVSVVIGPRTYRLILLKASATLVGGDPRRGRRLYAALVLTVWEASAQYVELLRLFVNKYGESISWTAPLAGLHGGAGFAAVDDDPTRAILISVVQSLRHPPVTWALVSKSDELEFSSWEAVPIAAYAEHLKQREE